MPKYLKNYRDKDKARKTRNRHRKNNYRRSTVDNKRRGLRWTVSEEKLIMDDQCCIELYNRCIYNPTDRQIAKFLGRSVQAIQGKRYMLKKKRGE